MGSLFQLRDYWSKGFTGEEFSASCIAVGDIDNQSALDKIAIGSFQGYLRIIAPGNDRGNMAPEDLLYEEKFDEPILQVACAPLEPIAAGINRNLLAILFPRRLLLTSIEKHGEESKQASNDTAHTDVCGDAEEEMKGTSGTYYKSVKYFETTFDHTAYNLVTGPFSRIGYHMTCVQSMDGQLSIIDHNKVLCKRFIPSNQFLVPGCLAYCPLRDTILTNNSSFFLMCYSFTTITNSVSAEKRETANSAEFALGVKIAPQWCFNLGDDAVDIKVCRLSRGLPHNDADVVVLCPYVLYVLTMDGVCRSTKRLDVETSSLGIYTLKNVGYHNLLVGTLGGTINVYTDISLDWSAKMKAGTPQCLHVAGLCGTEGMILALNSEGVLSVNYLGTDPADKPIQPLENQTASYTEMNQELQAVLHTIKLAGEEEGALPVKGKLELTKKDQTERTTPPKQIAPVILKFDVPLLPKGDTSLVVTLSLSLHEDTEIGAAENIVIQFQTMDPIIVTPSHHEVPLLHQGETVNVPLVVSAAPDKDHIIPSSIELQAVAVYRSRRTSHTWTSRGFANLPLTIVCRPILPVKYTSFSMQLNTDQAPPPSLMDLFPDLARYDHVSSNVVSVSYLNGADATILVSKNAARFKLQGSTLEGLWLLAAVLVDRLREHYKVDSSRLVFTIPDELPVIDFFAVIDTHYAIRKELSDALQELDKSAEFFRAVEKRLLARFRDRNPSSADAMTLLFDESYSSLVARTNEVISAKSRNRQAGAMLNCCTSLLFLWMRMKYPQTFEQYPATEQLIKGLFACDVTADDGIGWEETTEAALVQILGIKNKKAGSKTIEASTHTGNVKKYLSMLFDKVKAGKDLAAEKPAP